MIVGLYMISSDVGPTYQGPLLLQYMLSLIAGYSETLLGESGRPRHIVFSLLPSSRYSQMTNLPKETKGNNFGTGAVHIRFLLDAIS